MAQNYFTWGEKTEKYTEEQAKEEFSKLTDQLRKEANEIPVPKELDAERLLSLLENEVPGETKPPRVVNYKREYAKFIACAACFVMVIAGMARFFTRPSIQEALTGSGTSLSNAAQFESTAEIADAGPEEKNAGSYDDVYAALLSARQYAEENNLVMKSTAAAGVVNDGMNESASEDALAGASGTANYSASAETYHTGTNTQFSSVEEADIVKTDGAYLYQYRYDRENSGGEIAIVRADDLTLCSEITLPSYYTGELYLDEDTLILAADTVQTSSPVYKKVGDCLTQDSAADAGDDSSEVIVPDYYDDSAYENAASFLFVYDVSDRSAPKREAVFEQSGRYLSSRLADGVLYLLSEQQVDLYAVSPQNDAAAVFPSVVRDGEGALLPAGDILLPDRAESADGYCLVTAYALSDGSTVTKAVLGGTDTVVMKEDTLLLACDLYDGGAHSTGVTRFSVGGGDVLSYVSSGKINGWTDGQFAFDVSDGLLRVATTSYTSNYDTQNNLYLYDEKMDLVGSLEGLAEGEQIYSVRYFGDTAYVVTFRQTDPLFVIDLSDPTSPTVKGQLKIPGFSEYLHPVGENLLIGLGQNTTETSYGSVITDGLKLSLFDVSDPANPTELANTVIGNNGSYSAAIDAYKAFLYDERAGRIGFPATVCRTYGATVDNPWGTSSSVVFSGYLVYSFDRNGFTRVGEIPDDASDDPLAHSDSDRTIERGVVIGDAIYTVSGGRIGKYSYDTFRLLKELTY